MEENNDTVIRQHIEKLQKELEFTIWKKELLETIYKGLNPDEETLLPPMDSDYYLELFNTGATIEEAIEIIESGRADLN